MTILRNWWKDLTDLVLPDRCGGCGTARTALCARCRAALLGDAPAGGGTPGEGTRRVRPAPEPPGLPPVYATARYADEVRAVLLAHKERGALSLTAPLGTALARAVRTGLGERRDGTPGGGARPGGVPVERGCRVLLVPVPSARRAVAARGHDPVRRIALAAARELRRAGVPARVAPVLRQRRAVADQAGLDARRRQSNVRGALEPVPGGARLLQDGLVVLVDDLVTTGATLAEAARALREAGTPACLGAVCAEVTREIPRTGVRGARRSEAEAVGAGPGPGVTGAGRAAPGTRPSGYRPDGYRPDGAALTGAEPAGVRATGAVPTGVGRPGRGRLGPGRLGPMRAGAGRPGEGRPGAGRPGEGRPGAGRPGAGAGEAGLAEAGLRRWREPRAAGAREGGAPAAGAEGRRTAPRRMDRGSAWGARGVRDRRGVSGTPSRRYRGEGSGLTERSPPGPACVVRRPAHPRDTAGPGRPRGGPSGIRVARPRAYCPGRRVYASRRTGAVAREPRVAPATRDVPGGRRATPGRLCEPR